MKKIVMCFFAVTSLLSVSFAWAVNKTDMNGYSSTFHPNKIKAVKTLATQALGLPPTNITVLNYSNETIFVGVARSFEDTVPTGKADTITNPDVSHPTFLEFSHYNNYGVKEQFFGGDVCQRAIIIVNNYLYNPNFYTQFCY